MLMRVVGGIAFFVEVYPSHVSYGYSNAAYQTVYVRETQTWSHHYE
jgi:hypothetical protein